MFYFYCVRQINGLMFHFSTMLSNKLLFWYQNVRGLRTKTNDFYKNALLCDADLILITETWLCDGILDAELTSDRYEVFRRDRGSLGGGVMIMSAARLGARARPEWQRDDLECVWATVPRHSIVPSSTDSATTPTTSSLRALRDLHVGVVYLPPDKSIPKRIDTLLEVLSNILNKNPHDNVILVGDFNLSCIQWLSGEPVILKKGSVELQNSGSSLINQTSYAGLNQYNTLVNSHGNTLDLVFANFSLELQRLNNPLVKEDAHHPSFVINAIDLLTPPLKKAPHKKLLFRKADYSAINKYFVSRDWQKLLLPCDVKEAVDNLYSILEEAIEQYVPHVFTSSSHTYPVWYSRELIKLIKEKAKAHSNWKKYNNKLEYELFSDLRTKVKLLQNTCHKSYIEFSEDRIASCPKLFWSYVQSKRKINTNYPKLMYHNDNQLTNEKEVCLAFNEFFCKNFNISAFNQSTSSPKTIVSTDHLHTITAEVDWILKLLKSADPTKGAGSDKIPPLFYVNCAESLAAPITCLFNRCLREGYFPKIWKTAHIVPIHKKGTKTLIQNYRPISILNTLAKFMEKTVHHYLYPFIYPNIPHQQHGFIKGRSTNTNLAIFTNDVLRGMEGGFQVDVIYTDFEKAFDRVDHNILLRKLQELGICGDLLRWMESYLRNRSQAVVVGGHRSDFMDVPSGVPQGSILAPLLYAAYLYDVGKCFQNANYLMYADDTKIYYNIKCQSDCNKLQLDLNRLNNYYLENTITINVNKCMAMTITRKNKIINFEYKITNTTINRTQRVRDLGVHLDHKLTFNEHVSDIVSRSYKSLGFILRVTKPFSDIRCLKILYCAYVRSILEYCCNVWNPQYVTYIENIERIQSKFIKHLNYRSYHEYINYVESCEFHKIISLQDRRTLLELLFLHNVCHGSIDSTELTEQFMRLRAPKLRTRHTTLFHVPHARTNYYQNSIVCRTQRSFNTRFSSIDLFNCGKQKFKSSALNIIKHICN